MYPELPKTSKIKEYTVVMRRQQENCRVSIYDSKFNKISSNFILKNQFYVKDNFTERVYELKTKSNSLIEGDIIQVYFENGDYKVKKVDRNG
ncbi:S-adenosylmethionine:diacylglycerol 3-amino-3-carboxypropyl transferase [Methanococcus maripaludis]|uniref:S-adenosylmethionine:diacylglycerol 3-amino-3-carboxypropyl transferase n=1 Tax=Methanococcus maripaludis TaxID=39152 RepID=A0A7J9NVT1_METMI|nr:hypothetical protein [Methanococcus maripaludis]MBA2851427.1 S-adenosylmethionine:diacylglycerol 3-amino-3-carboxypropyl transferase [Methanococcus maripaludis]